MQEIRRVICFYKIPEEQARTDFYEETKPEIKVTSFKGPEKEFDRMKDSIEALEITIAREFGYNKYPVNAIFQNGLLVKASH